MILDLGCGTRTKPGAVGVDSNPAVAPDVLHDLRTFPYPFDDGVADEVHLDNVLEHLPDVVRTMEEIHRITKPAGLVVIDVPYFRSTYAAIDPTHRHQFTASSFAYFDPTHRLSSDYPYSPARFRVEQVTFDERIDGGPLRRAVRRWANADPERYERRLSHLYPLDELRFRLRAVPST